MMSEEYIKEKMSFIISKLEIIESKMSVKDLKKTFGLKTLRESIPLDFIKDINGISTATKKYILSARVITEEWKGRKNDFLIIIRQQERESNQDIKALGIRIPLNDLNTLSSIAKLFFSLLYIASEIKGIEINTILKNILSQINENSKKMIEEMKNKMDLPLL